MHPSEPFLQYIFFNNIWCLIILFAQAEMAIEGHLCNNHRKAACSQQTKRNQ